MTPKPRTPHGHGGDGDADTGRPHGEGGDGTDGRPSQKYGDVDASEGVAPAQDAIGEAADRGTPGGGKAKPGEQGSDGETGTPDSPDPTEPPPGVTFDDPRRPRLGSDGKYYIRDGDHDVPIDDPADVSRTITDIDNPEDGVLWEEKSAVNAGDVDRWVNKQVIKKIESYIDARQHIAGYEDAPVGIEFTREGADPAFRAAVEQAVADLRTQHPDVDIRVKWA